jgi:hypothetical protein
MTTTIKVRQRHINAGEPTLMHKCPIALAIQEATGLQSDVVGVEGEDILINGVHYSSPRSVTDFIDAFDNERVVFFFEFELPLK